MVKAGLSEDQIKAAWDTALSDLQRLRISIGPPNLDGSEAQAKTYATRGEADERIVGGSFTARLRGDGCEW
jgi:hypothetical protein